MNNPNLLLGWLPNDLSDESAYQLYILMEQLTTMVEQKYYSQIRRHINSLQPSKPENLDLWGDEIDF